LIPISDPLKYTENRFFSRFLIPQPDPSFVRDQESILKSSVSKIPDNATKAAFENISTIKIK
jgi:hypothetical protein